MKKMFLLAAVLVASSTSSFAFLSTMTPSEVKAEVITRAGKSETLAQIVAAARAAGVPASVIQSALNAAGSSLGAGVTDTAVFDAMVTAGYDVGDLLPPTAAGGGTQTAADGATGTPTTGFGQSRASTVGGGGVRSVSGS